MRLQRAKVQISYFINKNREVDKQLYCILIIMIQKSETNIIEVIRDKYLRKASDLSKEKSSLINYSNLMISHCTNSRTFSQK